MQEAMAGKPSALSQAEVQQAMMALQQSIGQKQQGKGADNKIAGEEFLAQNQNNEGVKTLPSGLQYQILQPGKGKSPC
jgi:FKBP-type peptidyl-prolyl cis-trans isomerase FklB